MGSVWEAVVADSDGASATSSLETGRRNRLLMAYHGTIQVDARF
jgi:hypothetical protein